MHISFVTNIISIHQMNLWDNFICHKNVEFTYLYTENLSNEKRYNDYKRDYCVFSKDIQDINNFLDEQDIIIVTLGSIEDERVNKYLKGKTNLVIYSEHLSKLNALNSKNKRTIYYFKKLVKRPQYYRGISRNNLVLCASSHAGYDFHITGFRKKNIYKFGYFPKYRYNLKIKDNHTMVFAGRNIYWKHYEDSLFALRHLRDKNYKYFLNIAGKDYPNDLKTEFNNVNLLGELNHEETINLLFESDLFVFSSTREEGWGVVLAEAMAAGCFVIANSNAGSTKYLVRNGYNGLTYNNRKQLIKCLNQYIGLSDKQKMIIRNNAVNTIKSIWNGEVAADRLYKLCLSLFNKEKFKKYKSGPLSSDKCRI